MARTILDPDKRWIKPIFELNSSVDQHCVKQIVCIEPQNEHHLLSSGARCTSRWGGVAGRIWKNTSAAVGPTPRGFNHLHVIDALQKSRFLCSTEPSISNLASLDSSIEASRQCSSFPFVARALWQLLPRRLSSQVTASISADLHQPLRKPTRHA